MTNTIDTTELPTRSMFGADFDALNIGESYEAPGRRITASDVSVFAGLTGDHHPIHVDPVWAATGPFGKPIAHGLLILSCAVGSLPLQPDRVIALRRIRDVVFKRPLTVGDSILVGCKVVGVKPIDDDAGLVECEWRIADQNSKLLARAVVEILWRRGAIDTAAAWSGGTAETRAWSQTGSVSSLDELDAVQVDDDIRVLI
jgi:acyl dehydratase